MRTSALEDHCVLFQLVDQQPIAREMAFPSALIVSCQFVVTKLRRQGLLIGNFVVLLKSSGSLEFRFR